MILCRKVQGTVKWVGTTEAAALLRQFGVRARVVDFKGGAMPFLILQRLAIVMRP